jgi:hypothetical protein
MTSGLHSISEIFKEGRNERKKIAPETPVMHMALLYINEGGKKHIHMFLGGLPVELILTYRNVG